MPGQEAALQAPTPILEGRTQQGKYFVFSSNIRFRWNKSPYAASCWFAPQKCRRKAFSSSLSIGLRSSDKGYLRRRDLACRSASQNASSRRTFASFGLERMKAYHYYADVADTIPKLLPIG
jgi:hypothetical protein